MTTTALLDAFLSRLAGVRKLGKEWQARCPAHDDRVASLSISYGDDGRLLFHCHAGCTPESVLQAVGLAWREVFDNEFWRPPSRPVAPRPQRTLGLEVQKARDYWEDLQHDPQVLSYLWRRRGVSAATALVWGVGATNIKYDGAGHVVGASWTFPVLSHENNRPPVGLKFHNDPRPENGPKCYWTPRGVCQTAVLFPLLEAQGLRPGDELIPVAGELKALGYLSAGYAATSRTAGEAAAWPVELAARFAGLRVVIDPDREDSQAAKTFVENAVAALLEVAASVEVCE